MSRITYRHGMPVPYITAWSAETGNQTATAMRMVAVREDALARVAYVEEGPHDRDAHGVLWQRYPIARGKGEPQFARVHPARQRRAMTRRLCQVCGDPADQNELGWLWLVTQADAERLAKEGPGDVRTSNPPVCHPCAAMARSMCPHLVKGNALVRASIVSDWGVYGIEVTPAGQRPGLDRAYTDPAVMQMVAGQQIVILRNVTPINWSDPA